MEAVKYSVIPLGRLFANCCVLTDDRGTAVVIDPGGDPAPVIDLLSENGLELKAILLTHGHEDHIEGVQALRDATGAPVLVGAGDAYRMPVEPDELLYGGERLRFGDISLEVIAAPGHTEGGVCYLWGKHMFCGDTLFHGSVGRTDLPGGDWNTLCRTLEILKSRFSDGDLTVIPGHGESFYLKHEMEYNPFL